MDKSVFYILCFLILQNSIAVLCEEQCKTVADCNQKVDALIQKTDTILGNIDDELIYIENFFDGEKQTALNILDINEKNKVLEIRIDVIDEKINEDNIAPKCVTNAKRDLTTEKTNAETAKSTCDSSAKKPTTKQLDTIKDVSTQLHKDIRDELEACQTASPRKIIKKYIYQYKVNDVFAEEAEVVECLTKILTKHSSKVDTQSDLFEAEKIEIHKVISTLVTCMIDIKFGEEIVPDLQKCVEKKYSAKIEGIQTNITEKSETEFLAKITKYETDKKADISSTVTKPEYNTGQECTDLQNNINGVLFANEKNPCVDSANKLADTICDNNKQCENSAERTMINNGVELTTFITNDLKQLDIDLSSKKHKCEDKNFDDKLKCLQDLLPFEEKLKQVDTNFQAKLTKFEKEDLNLATCLISKVNFNKDSIDIVANLDTCDKIQDIPTKTTTLSQEITKKIKYVDETFETDKQNAINKINFDEEHESLNKEITEKSEVIPEGSVAEQCVRNAETASREAGTTVTYSVSSCGTQAEKPSTKILNDIQTDVDKLKDINTKLTACLKKEKLDELTLCLNDLHSEYDSKVTQLQSDFTKEVNNNIDAVIPKLKACLSKIDFVKITKNILPDLDNCVLDKYSAKIESIQTSITEKSETEFPDKITKYEEDKKKEIYSTINDPKYATVQACFDLQNDIKRVLFGNENNPCFDSAKKLADNICRINYQCKFSAEGTITNNGIQLSTFITDDLNQLDTDLSSGTQKCKDKNFDEKLKCLQDLLSFEEKLNEVSAKFQAQLTNFESEDLEMTTCLITAEDFNKDSIDIVANLDTCDKIQDIPTKTTTLSQEITKKIKYVDETFETDKQNAINKINFDEEHESLNKEITEKSEVIPEGSVAEQCVRNAETASREAGTTVTDSVSSCGTQANKPSKDKLNSIKTEVDNLKDISTKLTTCLENEKLKDLTQCLNDLHSKYDPKVTQLQSDFTKEVNDNIDAVIPKLETCLGEIDFVEITKNILPDLDHCVLKVQSLVDLQTNINKLQNHLTKLRSDHKKVIEYIVSKINIKPTYDNILAEIEERGKNFTTDEVKKYCEGNATESIESKYNSHTAAQKECKTTAESAQVLKDLDKVANQVKTLGKSLAEDAKESCEDHATAEKDKTCDDIVEEYTQQLNTINGKINEDKIESDKIDNLKELTECLTPESAFKDESTIIMVEFLDCINAASNVYLNNMLYICCFILMLIHLM